jgi:hypothetical protein
MFETSDTNFDLDYQIRQAREKGSAEMLVKIGAPVLAVLLIFNNNEGVDAGRYEARSAGYEAVIDTPMYGRLDSRSMTIDISDTTQEQDLEEYLNTFSPSFYDAIKRKPTVRYAIENYNLATRNLGPAITNEDIAKLMIQTDWKDASRKEFETFLAILGPESGGTVDEQGKVWYHIYSVGDIDRDNIEQFSITAPQINIRREYSSDPYRNAETLLNPVFSMQAGYVIYKRQGFRAAWHTTVVNELHLKPAFMNSSLEATQKLVEHGFKFKS